MLNYDAIPIDWTRHLESQWHDIILLQLYFTVKFMNNNYDRYFYGNSKFFIYDLRLFVEHIIKSL